ncbi:hypothetical protein HYH03_004268 [Edaphochlamys debaryana]|uniref:CYTH domain-containing protein n=1 Tax=Edaphochlamys debaryana TaxID=47281 RepID=A0A836C2P9_9CHLO|nr:hypothetical protein HYH03_004268 [Edaphochlamys debaryana]|eukprot:KAG2498010.1 hypothetical protein HYH03_004268 [Edaphochlamys debaryana]
MLQRLPLRFTDAAAKAYSHRAQAIRQGGVSSAQGASRGAEGSRAAGGRTFVRSFAGGQALNGGTDRAAEVKPMEVEVKIRLPDRAAYDKVAVALGRDKGGVKASYAQANYFFDGPNRELNSRRVVLRLRTYNGDQKATITIKGKQVLENGIGTASEVEEDVAPAKAPGYLAAPSAMLAEVPLVKSMANKFGVTSLVGLGGFKNQRDCFDWEGHTLELDETVFEHGILYEIEVETDKPVELRTKLEAFLSALGVPFSYSQTSKFANFINKTLL